MPACAVSGCKNSCRKTKGTGVKFYSFPKDCAVAEKWVQACGRRKRKINFKNACICSIHFEPDSYEIPLIQRLLNYTPRCARNLKRDAVPTKDLPTINLEDRKTKKGTFTARNEKNEEEELIVEKIITETEANSVESEACNETRQTFIREIIYVKNDGDINFDRSQNYGNTDPIDMETDSLKTFRDIGVNTDVITSYLNDEINKLKARVAYLESENHQLKINEQNLLNNLGRGLSSDEIKIEYTPVKSEI